MKARSRTVLTFTLGLAALATAGLLTSQRAEHQALTGELDALPSAVDGSGTAKLMASAPPPSRGLSLLLKPFAAKSGDEARRELVRQLGLRRAAEPGSYDLNRLTPLVECLSAEELLAIIGTVPAAEFSLTAQGQERKPQEETDEAVARLAALYRLCVVSPEQALAICAAGKPPERDDQILNVTFLALLQRAKEDPVAALRWEKKHAYWMGTRRVSRVLSEVARSDGLASAAELAHQEGLLLADSMQFMDSSSLDSIHTLMTTVEAERAADPDGFAENGEVKGAYEAVAEKISDTFGFDETRKFAEKWTSELPWREAVALQAVQSTLDQDSAPETIAAADWMLGFVPEDRQADVAVKLLNSWTGDDSSALTKWLEKNHSSPWRDAALATFCRRKAYTDPGTAARWAATITDGTLRATTQTALAKPPNLSPPP